MDRPREIRASFYSHRYDVVPKVKTFDSIDALFRDIAGAAQRRDRKDGPTISGAELHEGTTRCNENVRSVGLVGVDFDDVKETIVGGALYAAKERGWAAIWHTTYSHDPESSVARYRVFLVPNRPLTPQEYIDFRPRLIHALGVSQHVDNSCKETSRMFYLPAAPTRYPSLPKIGLESGGPIDVDAVLAMPLPPGFMVVHGDPPLVRPEHARGVITPGLRTYWNRRLDELCHAIRATPYPGSIWHLKNNEAYGLGQGAPHIIDSELLRSSVISALTDRNPGVADADRAILESAIAQAESAIADGMACPWYPEKTHFPLTESGNAERFVKRYGRVTCWVAAWNKFAVFDGSRWSTKHGREIAFGFTKDIARSIHEECRNLLEELGEVNREAAYLNGKAGLSDSEREKLVSLEHHENRLNETLEAITKFAKQSESCHGRKAMLQCAQGESAIICRHDQFDKEPWLLNVSNGTLDLRSGRLREHRAEDMLTKITATAYDARATCPRFDRFLQEVFLHDDELVEYVLRALGYSLTGIISEHCMFIAFGSGRNGKTTLLNLMHAVLGDYAVATAPDLLLVERRDTHPTSRADLFGARFVSTSEIEEGRNLNEAETKALTGGDPITARHMREDYWTFSPTHKLWMATNALPLVRGMDTAIWSRLRAIPFDACFLGREDRNLSEDLQAEAPGILRELVDASLRWQRDGLPIPAKVEAATREYRKSQDALTPFLLDQFDVDPLVLGDGLGSDTLSRSRASSYRVAKPSVWVAYQSWAARTGRMVFQSNRTLNGAMQRFFEEKRSDGEFYLGLRPRQFPGFGRDVGC